MNKHSLSIYNNDIHTLSYWLNQKGDYSVLLCGFCHIFALLANKLFDKPICILTEQRYLNEIPVKGLLHAFIMLDDETIFDFEGTKNLQDVVTKFIYDVNNYEISIVEPDVVWMMLYGSLPIYEKFFEESIIQKVERLIKEYYIDFNMIKEKFRMNHG